MRKKDIKNGAVVELRNGRRYLKVDDTLLRLDMSGNFINIEHYNDNLISYVKELDIMRVLNPEQNKLNPKCCNMALTDIKYSNIKWTWERKEQQMKKVKLKDLTFEQYKSWKNKNCYNIHCKNCKFNKVICQEDAAGCWINHKDFYTKTFLNQKIYLEEE